MLKQRVGLALLAFAIASACDANRVAIPGGASLGAADARHSLASSKFAHSEWSEPVNLGPLVNSSERELSASLSPDELSLYIGSTRVAGSLGGQDLWVSHRACLECDWEAPVNLAVLNSAANEGDAFVTKDGHYLYFLSNRDGGYGNDDIYVSHRLDTKDDFAWETPVNVGAPINTADFETGPTLARSAEAGPANLYFSRGAVVSVGFDIYYGSVDPTGQAFGDVVKVDELNSAFADVSPTLIGAHEIYFWSTRPGGQGNADLWTSTRSNPNEPWSAPQPTGAPLSSAAAELTARLSHDGRTILISAGANHGGFGLQDIWMSTRTPSGK